jgi:hypothetical protein
MKRFPWWPSALCVLLGLAFAVVGGSLFGWDRVATAYTHNMDIGWAMRTPAGVYFWITGMVMMLFAFGLWCIRCGSRSW